MRASLWESEMAVRYSVSSTTSMDAIPSLVAAGDRGELYPVRSVSPARLIGLAPACRQLRQRALPLKCPATQDSRTTELLSLRDDPPQNKELRLQLKI